MPRSRLFGPAIQLYGGRTTESLDRKAPAGEVRPARAHGGKPGSFGQVSATSPIRRWRWWRLCLGSNHASRVTVRAPQGRGCCRRLRRDPDLCTRSSGRSRMAIKTARR